METRGPRDRASVGLSSPEVCATHRQGGWAGGAPTSLRVIRCAEKYSRGARMGNSLGGKVGGGGGTKQSGGEDLEKKECVLRGV